MKFQLGVPTNPFGVHAVLQGKPPPLEGICYPVLRTPMKFPVGVPTNPSWRSCDPSRKASDWRRALHFLAEMPAVAVLVDIITLNSAISTLEKGSQWARALQLFFQIHAARAQRDIISFNAVITACETRMPSSALLLFLGFKIPCID